MVTHSVFKFDTLVKFGLTVLMLLSFSANAGLVDVIKKITPSVVAIGIQTPLEYQGSRVLGTGFVVGNGNLVVTNYHVVSEPLAVDVVQHYVVLSGVGQDISEYKAEVVAIDPIHDVALLKIKSDLPGLPLASNELVDVGADIAFTGFPIGAVLGLYPATHRGIVAAITPDAIPAQNANVLTLNMLKRLKQPSLIYQLDATAYPGNSGSAVYDQASGNVVGIINKVIVRDSKESALSNPSGISYAVPVRYIRALADKHNLVL